MTRRFDRRVEYTYGGGSAAIDTGVDVFDGMELDIDFQWTPSSNYVFGSRQISNGMSFNAVYRTGIEYNYKTVSLGLPSTNTRVRLRERLEDGTMKFYIDDETTPRATAPAGTVANEQNPRFLVHGCINTSGGNRFVVSRIYSVVIRNAYEGHRIVKRLVPVVTLDGAATLYDTVDGVLCSVRGTASNMTAGPDVGSCRGGFFDLRQSRSPAVPDSLKSIVVRTGGYSDMRYLLDTGIDSASIGRVVSRFSFDKVNVSLGRRLMSTANGSSWRLTVSNYNNFPTGYVTFGKATGGNIAGHFSSGATHTIDMSYENYAVDGVSYGAFPSATRPSSSGTNLWLFGVPPGGGGTDQFEGVFHWAFIYDTDGNAIAEYFPCLKDGVCCIFDRVSKTFHRNHYRSTYGDFVPADPEMATYEL